MVLAVNDSRMRRTARIEIRILACEDDCAIRSGNSTARPLEEEGPGGILQLRRHADRLAPSASVIGTLTHDQLGRIVGRNARHRAPPGRSNAHAVRPDRSDPCVTGGLVHQDGRIPRPILGGRQATMLAEGDGPAHLLPSAAAIGRTAQADIDVFLQVLAVVVAHVIDGQQRSLVGGYQTRDAVRLAAVVSRLADTHAHAVDDALGRYVLQHGRSAVEGRSAHFRGDDIAQLRLPMLHLYTDPEIIDAREKWLVCLQDNLCTRPPDLRLQNRIGRIRLQSVPGIHRGDIVDRPESILPGSTRLRTAIIKLDGADVPECGFIPEIEHNIVEPLRQLRSKFEFEKHIVFPLQQDRDLFFPHKKGIGRESACCREQGGSHQKKKESSHFSNIQIPVRFSKKKGGPTGAALPT